MKPENKRNVSIALESRQSFSSTTLLLDNG